MLYLIVLEMQHKTFIMTIESAEDIIENQEFSCGFYDDSITFIYVFLRQTIKNYYNVIHGALP